MAVYGAFEPGSFNAWTLNLFADVFVTPGVARGMQVTAPGGMQVNVTLDGTANDGVCYLPNGCFLRIDSIQNFAVPNNSSGGTRTDAVVAFVDPSGVANPSVSLTYVTNWSSGFSPANTNQLVLALVSVPNGAVAISTGNITNNPTAAALVGTGSTGSSSSMVASDGVGLAVQDNTSTAILSVVLTGLTTGKGRSITIQTTDVSAIGQQSTFDQKGNLILTGSLTTNGKNYFRGLNPITSGGNNAYDVITLVPHSTPYSVNIGTGDGSFSYGIGFYAYDNFNNGLIFSKATKTSITFNNNVAAGGNYYWGPGVSGQQSYVSWDNVNKANTYYVPQTGTTHSAHVFVAWSGAQNNMLQLGGQSNWSGSQVWVDESGNIVGGAGNGIPTTRNNAALSVPLFTGTTTPTSPPTGSVWIKA